MRAAVATVLVAAAVASGCGYRLQGTGVGNPDMIGIRVIALAPFENRTGRPEIEQRVTEEIASELAKRGRYRVVTQGQESDAVLEGAISRLTEEPVQFNADGRATRKEFIVTLQATLRKSETDAVIWSQADLTFREQFDVPDAEAAFFDEETLALEEIARGAAGALVSSILEGF